ncbi:hypothetical protein E2C01_007239 [Portunus trituberculatus]|uniref:Uncharacterized protein n=1 Tax=Portunus trituberculatus TaxID=210409 RepID=A0A5B7CXM6_PORTR|nr:hypothetical protein [Portunus trituberculatus]
MPGRRWQSLGVRQHLRYAVHGTFSTPRCFSQGRTNCSQPVRVVDVRPPWPWLEESQFAAVKNGRGSEVVSHL